MRPCFPNHFIEMYKVNNQPLWFIYLQLLDALSFLPINEVATLVMNQLIFHMVSTFQRALKSLNSSTVVKTVCEQFANIEVLKLIFFKSKLGVANESYLAFYRFTRASGQFSTISCCGFVFVLRYLKYDGYL